MTRFVYATACSADGFIADQGNSLQWLFDVPAEPKADDDADGGPDPAIDDLLADTGVLVMGATTYRWLLDAEALLAYPAKWGQWYGERPAWVFTHDPDIPHLDGAKIRFVSGPVADHLPGIRADAGDRDVWLIGGGGLVAEFDAAGALDEIRLNLMPVTLGAGAPLLPRRITSERMRLVDLKRAGQRADLRYEVRRPE